MRHAWILVVGLMSTLVRADSAQVDPAAPFIGTWRLVSFTNRLVDGSSKDDPRSVGYVMYSTGGRMCAVIMDPSRPKWIAPVPTGPEAVAAVAGLISYCGRYEVHTGDGYVVHHVEIDRRPNMVGTDRKRWFRFDGHDRLVLRVDPSEEPGVVSSTLVWDRVTSADSR